MGTLSFVTGDEKVTYPIVLVRSHVELCKNVSRFPNLQNFHHSCVHIVDILEHVHQTNQQQEAAVDLLHDRLMLLGGERREEGLHILWLA